MFDCLIVPLLLWRRTRFPAWCVLVGFHLCTWALFPIGVFPWLMIGASTVFFAPDWPRRLLARPGVPWRCRGSARVRRSPVLLALAIVWVVVQLALPLRHLAYPGDHRWTGQGYRFAWNVLLIEKAGSVTFLVHDPATGRTWVADPDRALHAHPAPGDEQRARPHPPGRARDRRRRASPRPRRRGPRRRLRQPQRPSGRPPHRPDRRPRRPAPRPVVRRLDPPGGDPTPSARFGAIGADADRAAGPPTGRSGEGGQHLAGGGGALADAGGHAEAAEGGAGDGRGRCGRGQVGLDGGDAVEVAGPVLGERRIQRLTRTSVGSPRSAIVSRRSASTAATRASSPRASAASSPSRPTEARSQTVPSPPRCGHFDDVHEHAVMVRPSTRGTRKPLPSSSRSIASRGTARLTSATEA